jgi:hypothetical protein
MAAVSAESSKENYRRFLEKNNVIDALTKALVALYEEPNRPDKPLDFLVKKLNGRTESEFVELEQNLERAQAEIQALKARIESRS